MNRLIEKDNQGNWSVKGIRWEQLHEGQVITGELWKKLYGALWKLMEYEDTGMAPEEVEELNNFEKTNSYRLLKKLNAEERKHRWISVEEQLPEDDDMRFYMCIVQNHEDDVPMFCQYDGTCGFGFWNDIYDPLSLGFVDTEFSSMDEMGYEEVVAWQPLPAPYRTAPAKDNPSGSWQEQMMGAFLGDSRL